MAKKSYFIGNFLILLLLIISGSLWHSVYTLYSAPEEQALSVTFLNVKQGDSIIIKTPQGKNILIDGGTIPKEWSTFDAGKNVVVPYLKKQGIRKLDIVIATHPDLDHIGGLTSVLKHIKVDTFIDSGTVSTTQTYEALLKTIERKKIKYKIAEQGDLNIDPEIKLEILSQTDNTFINDSNNNSIVIKLQYKNVSFLLTGDIGEQAEKSYIKKYGNELKSTILKVSHHGGKNATSMNFLNYVQPEIAIISCGKNNPFGHPADETIKRLNTIEAETYRTDIKGNITIKTNGEKYKIITNKSKTQNHKYKQGTINN
jgi:DNA internalization-related competence protein ComEC/Rec2